MGETYKKIGKYEIRGEIGRGGFATVYRAFDPTLQREVALKVLAPHLAYDTSFAARFLQEAQVVAALNHPNIITVYEIGDVDGILFLSMELVSGGTLEQRLQSDQYYHHHEALTLLNPIANALDYAHLQGLVHRDVKPANVLLQPLHDDQLRPVVSDFGLVKVLSLSSGWTSTGNILGTAEYMAPEQADTSRTGEIGPATDIYSLGIVVYHMLTGQVPFSESSAIRVLMAQCSQAPVPPSQIRSDLPSPVSDAVLKALAKNPKDRYESAGASLQALAGVEKPVEPVAASATRPQPTPSAIPPSRDVVQPKRKSRRGLWLLLLGLIFGTLAVYYFWDDMFPSGLPAIPAAIVSITGDSETATVEQIQVGASRQTSEAATKQSDMTGALEREQTSEAAESKAETASAAELTLRATTTAEAHLLAQEAEQSRKATSSAATATQQIRKTATAAEVASRATATEDARILAVAAARDRQATVTEEARIAAQQAERDRLETAAAATAVEKSRRATATKEAQIVAQQAELARQATATEEARRETATEVARQATVTEEARQATAVALTATVEAKQAATTNWGNCSWNPVGVIASHNVGPAWCGNGSFITQFELDGAYDYSDHDSPIIGQAHCCTPNASWNLPWGQCAWVDVSKAGINSHQPVTWCPDGRYLVGFDLGGDTSYDGMDAPIIERAHCCALQDPSLSRWGECGWYGVETWGLNSHQTSPSWCPVGTYIVGFDLDREGSYDPHDSPVIGQVRCCRPQFIE